MPWDVKARSGKFVVVKKGTGKVVGTHKTRAEANAQLRALYASEGKKGKRR